MKTYYTAKTAEGANTPAQAKKLGTPAYGYATLRQALRYTPPGGYVEARYCDANGDWAGEIVACK